MLNQEDRIASIIKIILIFLLLSVLHDIKQSVKMIEHYCDRLSTDVYFIADKIEGKR